MSKFLAIKLFSIGVLIALLFCIPLQMIDGLIRERQFLRDEVVRGIADNSAYSQTLSGPILTIPYVRIKNVWRTDKETNEGQVVQIEEKGRLVFPPEVFNVEGTLKTETRNRGIYEAQLYHVDSRVVGHFIVPDHYGIKEDYDQYRFDEPYLTLGITDVRGISNDMKLQMNGRTLDFAPGPGNSLYRHGVHVSLPSNEVQFGKRLDYAFDLKLKGTSSLNVVPVGRDSRLTLQGDWPHPSFTGNFLPNERQVTDNGFTAVWQTSFFATNMNDRIVSCYGEECSSLTDDYFKVDLVNPVDQYLKTYRAIKYALLIIVLTFAGFFLFEILKGLTLHPIQYALVGLALAVFYLLLLSLSEHIGFNLAYLASSAACILLIGFYLTGILESLMSGTLFSGLFALLYALVFLLISREDYTLLIGAVLSFCSLALFMLLTRRLDWDALGTKMIRKPVGLGSRSITK